MEDFGFYITLGKSHILDPNGYDHILFVVALCLVYSFKDWKKVAWLITAFTIGHSLTLALATLKVVNVKTEWVEFLIPVTILLTAMANFFSNPAEKNPSQVIRRYLLALFFGLIHGLGFSNFLRSILGKEQNIILPLFYFNLGLEIGQLLIVFVSITLSYIFVSGLKVKSRDWIRIASAIIAGAALFLAWKSRIFWLD